jgi:TRAF3-interacting protein 1
MDRPRTALRAPPKQAAGAAVKDTRPTSKQDGQQTGRVIAEGDVTDDDEEEHASGALSAQAIPGAGRGAAPQRAGEEGHGMLVKKMLRVESEQIGDAEGEGAGGTGDPEKDRDRKRMVDEMARLRESIQALCKSTNPLARSMDYLQEDLDNMAKELDFWMKDRDEQTLRLEEEERATEVEVDKLYSELQGVEESIKEEELRIKDLKAAALENDKTVKNMLASIVRTNNTR